VILTIHPVGVSGAVIVNRDQVFAAFPGPKDPVADTEAFIGEVKPWLI
jgi:hypothetical protein